MQQSSNGLPTNPDKSHYQERSSQLLSSVNFTGTLHVSHHLSLFLLCALPKGIWHAAETRSTTLAKGCTEEDLASLPTLHRQLPGCLSFSPVLRPKGI